VAGCPTQAAFAWVGICLEDSSATSAEERRVMPVEQQHSTTHRFTVIFEKEDEGGYHVFCPTLPGCHTQSETVEEGILNIREAIQLYVDSLIEDGLSIPSMSQEKRIETDG
jgi:predicted RNase H-like HicB family nuclease